MNDDTLIKVDGLSKKFCRDLKTSLRYAVGDMFGEFLGLASKEEIRNKEFWALQDISFEVKRGECLGLIGKNGSGKTTLLSLLNGIIKPTRGRIEMHGRVNALIQLGAGFNPILTGRENVYVNGQVLGFSKREIDRKFDAIVDFAEIEEFIDTPVRNYSSGMKVRLGFAVASQMEPDVLLLDEVLAVGDIGFLLKCFRFMDKLMQDTAVILVSHTMPQISRVCNKIALLNNGSIEYCGDNVSEGIDIYYSKFQNKIPDFEKNEYAELLEMSFSEKIGKNGIYSINRLDTLRMNFKFKIHNSINKPMISLTIYDKEQRPVGLCYDEKGLEQHSAYDSDNEFNYYQKNVEIPKINLSKGFYSITIALMENFRSKPILRLQSIKEFQVLSKHDVWPPIEFESVWK
jgi:lipopolysaccharide transport system ATP-binding protein